jgi:hypothetical protein
MKRIPAGSLVLDKNVYPRTEVDADHVFNLHEAYKCDVPLPPPIVCGKTLRIVDGAHRISAWIRFRGPDAPLEVVERYYTDDRALFLDALKANAKHGRSLTTDDRRRSAGIADKLQIDKDLLATELSISRAVVGGLSAAARPGGEVLAARSPLLTSKALKRTRIKNQIRQANPMQDLKQAITLIRRNLSQVNPSVAAKDTRLAAAINSLHEDVDDFVRAMKKARPR